jgi:uncharacterized protein YkwD
VWLIILSFLQLFSSNPDYESFKNGMLIRVNELRQKGCHCGDEYMRPVPPVTWDDRLARAAAQHAIDMEKYNNFSHLNEDGTRLGDRVRSAGYQWHFVSENIAAGFDSMSGVMQAWVDSPGHCKNIMSPKVRQMGVAKKGDFWVQDFGSEKFY